MFGVSYLFKFDLIPPLLVNGRCVWRCVGVLMIFILHIIIGPLNRRGRATPFCFDTTPGPAVLTFGPRFFYFFAKSSVRLPTSDFRPHTFLNLILLSCSHTQSIVLSGNTNDFKKSPLPTEVTILVFTLTIFTVSAC